MIARLLILWLLIAPAMAHTVDTEVARQEGVVVTTHLGDEEATYSEYEVFAPGDTGPDANPYQIGRTDAHGRAVFLPDRAGKWRVKVKADSQHGIHGAEVTVDVDSQGVVKDYSKPMVATHTRLLIGVSLLFGLFGIFSLFRGRGQANKP